MADRTWNGIDTDVLDGPYSKAARRIWLHLCTVCPNWYGVFDLPLGRLIDHWEDVYTPDRIQQALDELQAAGKLKLYRNRNVVWLCSKFKREVSNLRTPRHWTGLHNHFDLRYPEVKDDFYARYADFIPDRIPDRIGDSIPDRIPDSSGTQCLTDSDSDSSASVASQPQRGAGAVPGASAPPAGEQPEPEQPPKPSRHLPEHEAAAQSVLAAVAVHEAAERVCRVTDRTWQALAAGLARAFPGVERCDEAVAAFRFGLSDRLLTAQCLDLARFTRPDAWIRLLADYGKRAPGESGETPAERAQRAERERRAAERHGLADDPGPQPTGDSDAFRAMMHGGGLAGALRASTAAPVDADAERQRQLAEARARGYAQ